MTAAASASEAHDDQLDGCQLGGDRLIYVADMLLELRRMTRTPGLETLAGLLELAHREACRQRMSR